MQRFKVYEATGLAPNGRLYAGDMNLLQDLVAAQTDLTQTVAIAALKIGENGLQLVRFGQGEARVTGALRTDGIGRFAGGVLPGAFTTAQRDAIPATFAPYGVSILNSDLNRYEWNQGTDAVRSWAAMGGVLAGSITDADVSPTAAIKKSKLDFQGGIVDGDVSVSAGILKSKINIGAGWTGADIAVGAAIPKSKLAPLGIVDADVTILSVAKLAPGTEGYVVTTQGGNTAWAPSVPSGGGVQKVAASVERTTTFNTAAHTEAAAGAILTAPAVTLNADLVLVEVFIPQANGHGSVSQYNVSLFQDGVSVGIMVRSSISPNIPFGPITAERRFNSPLSGAKVFSARGWCNENDTGNPSNIDFVAGTGAPNTFIPAFMRVSTVT